MNSSAMGLYFIKEINGFKKEGEADKPRQDQDNCKHSFLFSLPGIRQNGCPSGWLMHTFLIYNKIHLNSLSGCLPAPCQNGKRRIKMKKTGLSSGLVADVIFFYFPVERSEPDVQQTGGFGLIALGIVEHSLYVQLFHAGHVKGGERSG